MADPENQGPQNGEPAATPQADAGSPQRADTRTDGAPADDPDRARKANIQLELFWHEVNEVHLLLDFVSGRNDKSLTSLTGIPDPGDSSKTLSWGEVVDKICQIRFPPQGTAESKADAAAFLLMVKDRLNGIANPAKGLSVAYTAMFSGVALDGPPDQMGGQATGDRSHSKAHAQGGKDGVDQDQDYDLKRASPSYAREAYPNLEKHARRFKQFFDSLPALALIWAIITALFYWDTAGCNSILQQIAKADMDVASLLQDNPTLNTENGVCKRQPANASQSIRCQQLQTLRLQQTLGRENLAALSRDRWPWHPIGWVAAMFTPQELSEVTGQGCFSTYSTVLGGAVVSGDQKDPAQAREQLTMFFGEVKYCETFSPSALEQMAAAITSVFSVYVVPMMFGLLGTLAGLVRAIAWKVRDSTLSPRDYRLFIATIPLGVVAGLAIGLIFSSPVTYAPNATGLTQSITLSAAAFAFLAGYGADAFFVMIDNLLKRIFSLDQQSNGKS
jgi:hypothetical protein